MCQFSGKTNNLTFLAQICPEMDLGLEIQKTNVGRRIIILKIPCVPVSGKTENFDFSGLNLGKLLNYVQYFGSNNIEAEMSWVEVKMSWVEMDGGRWSWVHSLVIPLPEKTSWCWNITWLDIYITILFLLSSCYLLLYLTKINLYIYFSTISQPSLWETEKNIYQWWFKCVL